MSRENHRQAVYRMAAVGLLRAMHPVITQPDPRSFVVRIETTCLLCGEEIWYGDVGRRVHWHRRDADHPVELTVHYACPPLERRFKHLFAIDGDVIMRDLPTAQEGTCFRCRGQLAGTHSAQILTPDLWLRTIHWDCRKTSGPIE